MKQHKITSKSGNINLRFGATTASKKIGVLRDVVYADGVYRVNDKWTLLFKVYQKKDDTTPFLPHAYIFHSLIDIESYTEDIYIPKPEIFITESERQQIIPVIRLLEDLSEITNYELIGYLLDFLTPLKSLNKDV